MPRSGWLAIGAVGAALCGEMLGLRILAGGLAMAAALVLMLVGAMPGGLRHRHVPAAAAILCAAAAMAVRLAVLPPPATDAVALPDGDGPWHAVVVATGAPREGQPDGHDRTRRCGDTRRPARRDAPPLPGRRARPADRRRRTARATPRLAIRRVPRADRRGRHDPRRRPRARTGTRRTGRSAGNRPQERGGGARARPARARSGARGRDPDRAARARRPRARRGLHDGRREPRGRDLRLEHRDRRGRRRGARRLAGAAPALRPDHARDRRLRLLLRSIAVGRSRGGDGRRGPARAGVGACGTCGGGTRLGGRAAAARRPVADRRRRLPAVVPRDGGPHRLGDADR